MATIPAGTHGAYLNSARRVYIAMKPFNNDFYKYSTSLNMNTFVTSGTLTPVTSDVSKTPQGRTLRETGKKLYPGANPGITEYMVGVYDDQTGLNGFINPNSATFTLLNTDKPTYLPDSRELTGNGENYAGQTPNRGQPVFTHGDIIAHGNEYLTGNLDMSGNAVIRGNTTVSGYIASLFESPSVTASAPNNNMYVDARLGNYFVANLTYTAGAPGNTYLYFGTGTTGPTQVIPANGEVISVAIYNATGNTQTVIINQTYQSVQGYASNPGAPIATIPNGQVRTLSFISDGTYMYLNTPGQFIASSGTAVVTNTANFYIGSDGTFTRFLVKDPSIKTGSKVFLQLAGFGTNNGVYSVEHINDGAFSVGSNTAAGGFIITIAGGAGSAVNQTFYYQVVN